MPIMQKEGALVSSTHIEGHCCVLTTTLLELKMSVIYSVFCQKFAINRDSTFGFNCNATVAWSYQTLVLNFICTESLDLHN